MIYLNIIVFTYDKNCKKDFKKNGEIPKNPDR